MTDPLNLLSRRDLFAAIAMHGIISGRNPAAIPYKTEEVTLLAAECADYLIMALDAPAKPNPVDPLAASPAKAKRAPAKKTIVQPQPVIAKPFVPPDPYAGWI